MSKKLLVFVSVLMVAAVALSSCASPTVAPTEEPEVTEAPTEEAVPEQPFGENLPTAPTIDTPLVVAYSEFSQKFSPFFADTGYDIDVAGMTQIGLADHRPRGRHHLQCHRR